YPHQLPAIALIACIADLRSGIFITQDLKPKSNKDWFQISINFSQDHINDSDAVTPERIRLLLIPVKPNT
ncbi:652_t:CDS:1, partial [Funneliformis geosporum]